MSQSNRCTATKANGGRCGLRTRMRFPYCWIHTRKKLHVAVKDSNVPGAGKGLFALKRFRSGEKVIDYKGPLEEKPQGEAAQNRRAMENEYLTETRQTRNGRPVWVNGEDASNSSVGRYSNCRRRRDDNNAEFKIPNRGRSMWPKITVKRGRSIQPGREIFTDYGEEYRITLPSDRLNRSGTGTRRNRGPSNRLIPANTRRRRTRSNNQR